MATTDRSTVTKALAEFQSRPLKEAAQGLLDTLGYRSDRSLAVPDSSPRTFLELFSSADSERVLDQDKAMVSEWKTADLLFQLTDRELSHESSLFTDTSVKAGLQSSYVFVAVELKGSDYPRGRYSAVARQINRIFPMPVMVFFKHQRHLTIAVINRRVNKRDENKDVLGKVTLIKEVDYFRPHPGHLDILASLALSNLVHPQKKPITDFDTLHAAWEQIFNIELLNERFYRELANWYFWALPKVEFPADLEPDSEKRRATGLIRLLTRLIFCWFLKEKGLIPEKLFNLADIKTILKDVDDDGSSYYQAILQNLFFATLNQRMGKDSKGEPFRAFATDEGFLKNRNTYDINNLYRYEALFRDSTAALSHFEDIPFLNGGLFECLDRPESGSNKKLYLDGFSRNAKKRPIVPNRFFFADDEIVNLAEIYGDTRRRAEKVSGLIHILNRYKFTIVENTPIDQEIALDPELLGKVFENLLASYNKETETTARKQTGSFYTPRPIVDFMVEESLKSHLTKTLVDKAGMKGDDARAGLDILFAYTEREHAFSTSEVVRLIAAIDSLKILDPACGSGAFPMGVLHKLVYILGKLDRDNGMWKQTQLAKLDSAPMREELERAFQDNNDDYGRKLYLIENCLYGADIQPIAIQIAKLRFFISLVCDQKTNRNKKENHGIRPLPNLETKFVAADSLIGLRRKIQRGLFVSPSLERIEGEIRKVRHDYFSVQTRQKKVALQRKDRELRDELASALVQGTFADQETSVRLAKWDPYDPHVAADFFEPLWMFDQSVGDGFDIVIGNPPYIQIQKFPKAQKEKWVAQQFATYDAMGDIYCLFYERGAQLLREGGHLCYITSNKWMRAGYGEQLREYLSDQVNTTAVLDFGMAQNFSAATTYTCITSFAKQPSARRTLSCYASDAAAAMSEPAAYFARHALPITNLNSSPWVVVSPERHAIKVQVESQGVPLEDWNVQINYGVKTGFNDAFYLTQEERDAFVAEDPRSAEFLVRLLRGRYIERYATKWDGTWMIATFPAHHLELSRLPRPILQRLKTYRAQLEPKPRNWKGAQWDGRKAGAYEWFETQDVIAYHEEFTKPKIIYQDIAQQLPFYLDEQDGFFFNNTCWMMTSQGESIHYLTAVFNSYLFRCCFRDNFPEYSGNAYRLFAIFFEKIPIKKPAAAEISLFERLVPLIQFAKADGEGVSGVAAFLEDLIDACVMECYFRDHMAKRDLLFHDSLAAHLAAYDPKANKTKQRDYLTHLYHTINAPSHPIRNRLLRITADSPDLLAVIKREGAV